MVEGVVVFFEGWKKRVQGRRFEGRNMSLECTNGIARTQIIGSARKSIPSLGSVDCGR